MATIFKRSPAQISERRIDPWHYQPDFEKQIDKIAGSLGALTLDEVIETNRGIAGGATPLGANYLDHGRIKFYRTSEVEDMFLQAENAVFISDEDDEKLKRSRLTDGDVLLTITGAKFGKSAVVSSKHLPGNISQHSVRFRPDPKKIDAHFLVAFLNGKTGQIAIWREAYGATRPAIDFPSVRSLVVPKASPVAQKYIGDKVRQAEQLRAWAKRLEVKLALFENQIPTSKPVIAEAKHSKATLEFLTENRLDARYYSKKHLDLYAQFDNEFESFGSICSGFKYGASIAANYVNSEGLPFIRGNALSPNRINQDDIVYLSKSLEDELKTAYVEEGDILITRSGTVGVTTYVAAEHAKYWYGSFIIKCKLAKNSYLPAYISWYLNSWVGQQQFRRLENGAVQLNINTEELSSISIWKAPQEFQTDIEKLLLEQISAINLSKSLTNAAKILVEALIEGQLTEKQLIQAQQALDDGDNSLDQAILSKLSSEGYAIEGATPLFSDIDELYRLLENAAQAEFEE